MPEITLLHNPRCSKSRAALALLEDRGLEVRVVRYLESPLSVAELETLSKQLGLEPGAWVRTGESAYREAGLSTESSPAELLEAMARNPILIERPILVNGERAVVGRPPERVLELV